MCWRLIIHFERGEKVVMATNTKVSAVEHAALVARKWVGTVAEEFDTDDYEFVYGVLRAWLHTLRDRLTVESAAHFSAQLPDLLRGVFFAGWDPNGVPVKYDAQGYSTHFAREANIAVRDVGKAAPTTTSALLRLLPATQIDKVLSQLPEDIRALLRGRGLSAPHAS